MCRGNETGLTPKLSQVTPRRKCLFTLGQVNYEESHSVRTILLCSGGGRAQFSNVFTIRGSHSSVCISLHASSPQHARLAVANGTVISPESPWINQTGEERIDLQSNPSDIVFSSMKEWGMQHENQSRKVSGSRLGNRLQYRRARDKEPLDVTDRAEHAGDSVIIWRT